MVDDASDLNPGNSKHNTKSLKTPLTYDKYASQSEVQQCK